MELRHLFSPNDTCVYPLRPISLALLPLLLLCALLPIFFLRRSRLRLPPSPPGLPIIGHLHLLGTKPHRSLWELSKRYGPLMSLRFGSVPVIIASSPATARLILQKYDHIFAGRTRPAVAVQIHECKSIVFSQPGPYLKLVRQLCFSELFINKRLEFSRSFIFNEVRHLLREVAGSSDRVFVREKLYEITVSIISRMTIGKNAKDVVSKVSIGASNSLLAALLELIHLVGVFNVGDYIPLLGWMDFQGMSRRSKTVSQKLRTIFGEVIDERRNERQKRDGETADADFLDVLLTTSSRQTEVPITDLHITAVMADLFGAGIDTSTATIEWALAELLGHPHILKKLQDELSSVVGSTRLVQESDVENLPYLRAVVKETMRLHPAVPLLLPHAARQQCQVNEYDIPSGTPVYVNVWAIGRDPNAWENPLKFHPERFLDSKMDVRGHHFELLPFGSGRRGCPGLALGISNVHLMLANLVHVFEWATLTELDMTEKFGVVYALANPLVAKAELKVPKQVIETEI
ncbi:hypothetical protein KP509_05G085200 [Ceratopteris richardii]|uniref:Cytochrome P450 n=1 Tax=Ceratopteris richardii TaxID=49495 RepID=A0A8T2USW7_CERRI|nr:hypothetical protein KP509_05G085200 [Ceratopteris richardii]